MHIKHAIPKILKTDLCENKGFCRPMAVVEPIHDKLLREMPEKNYGPFECNFTSVMWLRTSMYDKHNSKGIVKVLHP